MTPSAILSDAEIVSTASNNGSLSSCRSLLYTATLVELAGGTEAVAIIAADCGEVLCKDVQEDDRRSAGSGKVHGKHSQYPSP